MILIGFIVYSNSRALSVIRRIPTSRFDAFMVRHMDLRIAGAHETSCNIFAEQPPCLQSELI